MKIISDDPNLTIPEKDRASPSNSRNQAKLQEHVRTTVVDAHDRVPQFAGAGYGGINVKSPAKHVYSEVESGTISKAHVTNSARAR
ncbi:hypothetical protein ABIB99_004972 [Bradyrhizobium sp. LA6.1]|uniref:hypothetical protein n=1 Tax=Bradyrhizobium sp. LA6.1 TaxID=3156378 RepID=UPI003394D4CA